MQNKLTLACVAAMLAMSGAQTQAQVPQVAQKAIGKLVPTTIIPLGKTADWVEVTTDAVWVGSTGPNAVHRIDPLTNRIAAAYELPGEPCAGIAAHRNTVWVPLCGKPNRLARIDTNTKEVKLYETGPLAEEGGITAGPGSVWLVSTSQGALHRIDPDNGAIMQIVQAPAGSYNPLYFEGKVWVTRADGAEVTVFDAATGNKLTTVATGPGPRFLTGGAGSVWTLNQGDGTLTRIDALTHAVKGSTQLKTPGHGGDIKFGGGMIWTTMAKVPLSMTDAATGQLRCQWTGAGGDSLGVGHNAIWLTDYHGGTVARIELQKAIDSCK